ncbi:hypothetical protein B6U99_06070 [Candidatus Geothermarchaeota archaeon ex4572_27]|nr:MAG: hypothetical protein B6U99_06070 [Candidatus Geothermarchaeota archaeon ex4572_27]
MAGVVEGFMEWRDVIKGLLEQNKGFEVSYEGGEVRVGEVRGVSKAKVKLGELRRYAGRKVIGGELREVAFSLAERLIEARVPFKVVIGSGEFTLRFDLDHYVRVHGGGSVVVGFNSRDEGPLRLIYDVLEGYGPVKLLAPVR